MPTPAAVEAYVEEVALYFEAGGMPRIAGRILGFLLVCDPPHRSGAELAEALHASKASVSTMTRMLLGVGLIEKVAVPGARATYYRLRDDGFDALFEAQLGNIQRGRALMDAGLDLLGEAPPKRQRRLRTLRAIYAFYADEMPALLERWRAARTRLIGPPPEEER